MTAKPGQAERVLELLLTNPRRIEQGERGNLAFGVHRSLDHPNEFWLYETWESADAVEAHESGDAFLEYKEQLRPLVDGDTVLFGNCAPIKVLGWATRWPADRGVLIEDDDEKRAVERIVPLHREGRSLREIAANLEVEGHRPRRATTWHPAVLCRILQRAG